MPGSSASGDLLFPNLAGNPLDPARYLRVFTAAKAIAFAVDDPLRRATPYSLRHANATLLLNAGVPIADAARRLGHSPDVLLSVYAGVMTTDETISNSRVDELLTLNDQTNPDAAPIAAFSTNKNGETSSPATSTTIKDQSASTESPTPTAMATSS